MAKMKKKTKRLLLNITFVVALIAITLTVLFVTQKDDLDFNQIVAYFKEGKPVWIVGAFGCMLLFIFFEGIGLFILSRFFGGKPNIISAMAYANASAFYSAITPTGAGGQPAQVFYMSRDGMSPGKASFAILLNTIGYTMAIFAIGVVAVSINPQLFVGINDVFAKVLIILGAVIQAALLGLFIGCMFFGKLIIKIGFLLVAFLSKIKLVKKPDKWRAKIVDEVTKYGECRRIFKEKPLIILTTLVFNILQRVAQTMIPCFVCLAVNENASFLDIFVMQVYVLFGYNSIPIPGGVGAYEYMFMNVYGQVFTGQNSFILLVLMISRLFSYYFTIVISGIYTLTYHMVKAKKKAEDEAAEEQSLKEEQPPEEGEEQQEIVEGEPQAELPQETAEEELPTPDSEEQPT